MTVAIYAKRNQVRSDNVYQLGGHTMYSGKIGVIDYAADSGSALLWAMIADLRSMSRGGHLPSASEVPFGYEADHIVWIFEAEIVKPSDAPFDANNLFFRQTLNGWIGEL